MGKQTLLSFLCTPCTLRMNKVLKTHCCISVKDVKLYSSFATFLGAKTPLQAVGC